MNLEFNIINAILVMAGIIVFVRFGMPYLRKNNLKMYEEVKLALMLFGYSFRDEKVKAISQTVLAIVKELEKLDLSPDEKLALAMTEAFETILFELKIELDEEAIKLLVQVAVSFLPPTKME